MSNNDQHYSRRDFIRMAGVAAGAAGLAEASKLLGQTLPSTQPVQTQPTQPAGMPTRPFGKTGVDVPILALGGIFDITQNQLMLKQALQMGVSYWDTAASYVNGRSEEGIGMYFARYPEDRLKVFLVTKSAADTPEKMASELDQSLTRLKTDHVDLLFRHGLSSAEQLSKDADQWRAFAERLKSNGTVKFFGFSCHKNMAQCLQAAAKAGWIDGVMFTYNYRLMDDPDLKAAIDACYEAGIGLIAMKTQGRGPQSQPAAEASLIDQFTGRGFSPKQAAVKAIWQDARIAAVCSAMYTIDVIKSNVAAATDRQQLSSGDLDRLRQFARRCADSYCAGCGDICGPIAGCEVADIMRCLMYYSDYGDRALARESFAQLAASTQAQLTGQDFAAAERACPRCLPIAQLMQQAAQLLT